MMSLRRLTVGIFVAALVLTLVLPGLVASGPKPPNTKGPRVKAKISVEASVTAVNPPASTFTIQVLTPGHRKQVGAATAVILVQRGTEIKGAGDEFPRPASVSDLRNGDRAHVEAFRLDDGRFLALRIQVKNRAIGAPVVPPGQAAEARGVVTTKASSAITVLGTDGVARTVLVTPATEVRGQRDSFAAIQVRDIVVVQGTVDPNGTVTARRVDVVFAGTSVTGVVTVKTTVGPQFLILNNGLAVSVSSDTIVTSGGQRKSYDNLQVGQTLTVNGTPITVGGATIGINARVISF